MTVKEIALEWLRAHPEYDGLACEAGHSGKVRKEPVR